MVLFGFGMGLNFVTLTLTAVSGVAQHEAGAASGLLNASQQVGGSLGLSILVTVFGTASRNEAEKQIPSFMAQATPEQKATFAKSHELPARWGNAVLTQGISTAFTAAVAMVAVALLTAMLVIRMRESGLDALSGKRTCRVTQHDACRHRSTISRAYRRESARRHRCRTYREGCVLHLSGSPGTTRTGSLHRTCDAMQGECGAGRVGVSRGRTSRRPRNRCARCLLRSPAPGSPSQEHSRSASPECRVPAPRPNWWHTTVHRIHGACAGSR